MSDPHFGTETAAVVEALAELADAQSPDAVILSGDITQRARRVQFAAARAFVDRVRAPVVLAIPGNHDIPLYNIAARAFAPYAGYQRAFGPDLAPSWCNDDVLVICVNTTRRWRHKDGEVSARQVGQVAERLACAGNRQLRIVVVHQPVHVITAKDETNRLHGYEHAVRTWSQAGADLVLGGHIHLPYRRSLRERFHDLPRDLWAVQAGTAVSSRVRGNVPNSVNIIRHDAVEQPGSCVVERWDCPSGTGRFEMVETQRLELDRTIAAG
jgi:3',5'-cyclic AMP phosphodiesterase CpdA